MLGDRWGVTDEEVARPYPCDDVVPDAAVSLWRGVTVATTPERVWPWLCQLRLAPYSYDWLDNLGQRSPQQLRGLPAPRPGEPFSRVAGRLPVGRVLAVAQGESLTASIAGAVMSYVLVPDRGATRLLLKVVLEHDGWRARALALGDWPMARKQLLNLARLAESPPG